MIIPFLHAAIHNKIFISIILLFLMLGQTVQAKELKTHSFGDISIQIPSEWNILSKSEVSDIARIAGNASSSRARLLVARDRNNLPNAIVRLSRIRYEDGFREYLRDLRTAPSSQINEITREYFSEQARRNNGVVKIVKYFPISSTEVGSGNYPAMLINYVRKGTNNPQENWSVRMYTIAGFSHSYLLTISYNQSDIGAGESVKRILNSIIINR